MSLVSVISNKIQKNISFQTQKVGNIFNWDVVTTFFDAVSINTFSIFWLLTKSYKLALIFSIDGKNSDWNVQSEVYLKLFLIW